MSKLVTVSPIEQGNEMNGPRIGFGVYLRKGIKIQLAGQIMHEQKTAEPKIGNMETTDGD